MRNVLSKVDSMLRRLQGAVGTLVSQRADVPSFSCVRWRSRPLRFSLETNPTPTPVTAQSEASGFEILASVGPQPCGGSALTEATRLELSISY